MSAETKTLADIRSLACSLSDMENSDFVSLAEWHVYINLGLSELFDMFVEVGGPDFFLKQTTITLTPPQQVYDLPSDFQNLLGCDFTQSAPDTSPVDATYSATSVFERENPSDATPMQPYNFRERTDRYVDTNGTTNRHGHLNVPRYRVHTETLTLASDGSERFCHRIRFAPLVSGTATVWYAPLPPRLSADTDTVPSFNGLEHYPALFAARAALSKEESDTSVVQNMMDRLEKRIRTMAGSRDRGGPGRVGDHYSHHLYPTDG